MSSLLISLEPGRSGRSGLAVDSKHLLGYAAELQVQLS